MWESGGLGTAQAGILGKIKGAVKTVGSEAKKFATDTAKHAKTSAKIVGGKAKAAGGAVANGIHDAAFKAGRAMDNETVKLVGKVGKGLAIGAKETGK